MRFRDRTLGGGYLTLNGAHQTDGAVFDEIPIGQIGQWAFVAGPSGASDTIGFNAYDSHGVFSTAVAATVTVPAAAPGQSAGGDDHEQDGDRRHCDSTE